jgi:hypothetical protein
VERLFSQHDDPEKDDRLAVLAQKQ